VGGGGADSGTIQRKKEEKRTPHFEGRRLPPAAKKINRGLENSPKGRLQRTPSIRSRVALTAGNQIRSSHHASGSCGKEGNYLDEKRGREPGREVKWRVVARTEEVKRKLLKSCRPVPPNN